MRLLHRIQAHPQAEDRSALQAVVLGCDHLTMSSVLWDNASGAGSKTQPDSDHGHGQLLMGGTKETGRIEVD
ncbi:MAG: hypothetical protein APF80_02335 [Alphaproteobacteria bacterium BRH_c36]|nr:MAG: hypothetical protein APF80_02335 [Alphaproteobacteria bacterium BRH_c36]